MSTFLSGTDLQTLKEEGRDRNNFVSLIVNNAGTYTAAITRRVKTKRSKETVYYEFFCDGEKFDTKDYVDNTNEIEWFYLEIEKEGEVYSFPEVDARLNDIKRQKIEKAKVTPPVLYTENPSMSLKVPTNVNYGNFTKEVGNNRNKSMQLPLFHSSDLTSVDSKIIDSIIKQLITCSIIIPNDSKLDVEKWAENMPILCKRRFGDNDDGLIRFQSWAEFYVDFLTWDIEDKNLIARGLDRSEIQIMYANNLIDILTTLPKNDYIKVYISELKNITNLYE